MRDTTTGNAAGNATGNATGRATGRARRRRTAMIRAMIPGAAIALLAALPGAAWSAPQIGSATQERDAADRPSASDTRPRSARPLGARLGQRLGVQTSQSPAPIGHPRRRPATRDRSPLPTQVLVDADAAPPQ